MRLVRIWTLIAALAIALCSIGCKEDPMDRARTAHATERADEAEKALKEVLASKPNDFEARRLMADVHRFRGDYQKTEEALNELWKEKGFDDEEKEVAGEEAAHRDLLENQFNELYAGWSDKLDPAKDAEKYEEVVRSGLDRNPKSAQLNRKLVDFYLAKAKKLEGEGSLLEAAEAYENILGLRTLPAQRKDAEAKADELRTQAFAAEVKKRFTEEVKPKLVEAEQWDEEKKAITMRIEAEVNRRLRQRNEEDLAKARKTAGEAIRTAIAQMIKQVTGVADEVAAVTAVKMTSGDESLGRGKYEVSVMMTLDDVIAGAFKAKEKVREAKERAARAEKAKAEEGEPAEGDEAGGTNNGGTNNGATNSGGTNAATTK